MHRPRELDRSINFEIRLSLSLQNLSAYQPIPGENISCAHSIYNLDTLNLNSAFRSQKGFPIWTGIGVQKILNWHLWSTIDQSLLNKHESREGILRYNESYFHYSAYIYEGDIFQLEDKFTLMDLPSHNTFPNKGLLVW